VEYDKLPIEERREKWKTPQPPEARAKTHKARILAKTPLLKSDLSALKNFEINLKYLKNINEIIKEFGGMRPNPETISDLLEIRFETDLDFQKLWKEVHGNKPFSTKNLSPSNLRNTYNRAMGGTKKVTADNFKKAITDLFGTELKGSGTSLDDFIKNDFKFTETFLVDQADSPQAKYQRRYKDILKGKPGWTVGGKGSWAWFANPEQKGTTVTTNLNKRLKLDKLSKEGKGALEFVRSHYFGNIQGKKLYDLGLLDEDAAKNWKERYTWKPRYINDLQSMTYDRDVYKALRNYNNHGDKSKLASEINEAATKAKRLGLDVDELKLNTETGKFNFIDKKRILQTGGDRETRYLAKNAMNEIANVQSMTEKEISGDIIKNINKDYGKRAEKIINQVKKGTTHFYPETPKWSQRIVNLKKLKGTLPPQFGLGAMGGAGIQDFLESKGVRKAGAIARKTLLSDWVLPEIAIGVAEFINRKQKGQKDRALGETMELVTLGLYDSGATEEAILSQGDELNWSEKDKRAVKEFMRYKKLEQETKEAKQTLEGMELGGTELGVAEGAQALQKKIDDLKKEQESVAGFYYGAIGDKDANYGVELFDTAVSALGEQEFQATLEDRLGRRDPYAGGIGNWLQNRMFTTSAPERTAEQERIDAMSDAEKRQRGIDMGLIPRGPLYGAYDEKKYEDLYESLGYMYPKAKGGRVSYLDGGLASLLKK